MTLQYQVIRSNRRTIAIQIMPSGQVVVRAPRRLSSREIFTFVESKRSWIEKHRLAAAQHNEKPFHAEELEILREKTKELVSERVDFYASRMGLRYNRITVRMQRTRWGSCSSKGNLNFNCLLALVPPDVLDYVVVHELCHLKQMNHSADFWAEVEKILPNYCSSRQWLKKEGSALIRRLDNEASNQF